MLSYEDKIKRIKNDMNYLIEQSQIYNLLPSSILKDMFIIFQDLVEVIEDLVGDSYLDCPRLPEKIEGGNNDKK
jgi:hypothetical protein